MAQIFFWSLFPLISTNLSETHQKPIHPPFIFESRKNTLMTRSEAARINGSRSNGPVTEEGKGRSSRNARSHGLCSEVVVMEGEGQEAFDALTAAIFASHLPETIEEADLVFEIAANRWRLRRCMEMEKALFEETRDRLRTDKENPITDEQILRRKTLATVTESSAMKQLHRYNSRLRRAAEKAEQEFQMLKRERLELQIAFRKQQLEEERLAAEAAEASKEIRMQEEAAQTTPPTQQQQHPEHFTAAASSAKPSNQPLGSATDTPLKRAA